MATNVIMPALGMAQETGKVLQWLKREGDAVTKGEPLLEIETDKATVELEAPASGILRHVTAAAGETVPVGQAIAQILAPGESPQDAAQAATQHPPSASVSAPAAPGASPAAPGPSPTTTGAPPTTIGASPAAPGGSRRIAASPKARRLARERGVDLAALVGSGSAGTGPGGAVLAADVIAAQGGGKPAPAAAPATTLSTTWRLMAERTTQAWTTVPHFFLLRDVDASRLVAYREEIRKRFTVDVTYSDLLVKLVAAALREHPRLNARWEGGTVVHNDGINIGLAVANDEGLVVPVLHGADRLSLIEIAERRAGIVGRARAVKLRPEDIRGGTFTISNLGMYAVDAFNAIINAPQAAILAVGRIVQRVVPVDGRPAVRPMLMLSLSCDHRVVDGARAARFLERLADLIEEPSGFLD